MSLFFYVIIVGRLMEFDVDMQMVSLTLRVMSRPDIEHLPKIYQSLGLEYAFCCSVEAL